MIEVEVKDGFEPVRSFKKVKCIEINSGIMDIGSYEKRLNGFTQAPVVKGNWIIYVESKRGKTASLLITHIDVDLDEVDLSSIEENSRLNVGDIDEREGFNKEMTKQVRKVKEKKTALFTVKDSESKNTFKLVVPTGLFPVYTRWIDNEIDILFVDFYGYY